MTDANWTKKKLKNVTRKIGSGATPRGGEGAYQQDGIPLIRSLNIFDLNFNYDGLAFIDESQAEQLANVTVEKDDVLLNITGASVCRCTSVPDNLVPARVNQHVAIIRADRKNLDGKYLKYVLVSPSYKRALLGLATTGATREALTKSDIENFELKLPEIKTQSRIASILSAYDDLIENNEKRIKILEEMAQRLYTEWFVKFKFPGHKKVKMVDSGTRYGMIPEGWEVRKLQDLYETSSGGTPSRKNEMEFYSDGSIHWVKTKELNDNYILDTEENITELAVGKSSAKMFPRNTVLLAMYGATIGKLGILSQNAATNQACCAFLIKESLFSSFYIFQFLKNSTSRLTALAFGGAQPNISQNTIKNLLMLRPADKVMEAYDSRIEVVFNGILFLQQSILVQTKIRNLLIPQLVSGKRKVK